MLFCLFHTFLNLIYILIESIFNNVLNLHDNKHNVIEYISIYRELCLECLEGKFNRTADIYRYVVVVYRLLSSCSPDTACKTLRSHQSASTTSQGSRKSEGSHSLLDGK